MSGAGLDHEKYLFLLRPYFDKLNVDVEKTTDVSKRKMLEEIIRELVLNATNANYEIFNYQSQSTVFIIDDAQYIDQDSWQYLHLLGSAPTSLLVMAMREPTLNDEELYKRMVILRDAPTTKHIPLLGSSWLSKEKSVRAPLPFDRSGQSISHDIGLSSDVRSAYSERSRDLDHSEIGQVRSRSFSSLVHRSTFMQRSPTKCCSTSVRSLVESNYSHRADQ